MSTVATKLLCKRPVPGLFLVLLSTHLIFTTTLRSNTIISILYVRKWRHRGVKKFPRCTNPSSLEAESGKSSWRPSGLHSKTLSQAAKIK